MIDRLKSLAVFAETVREGSFRGAARQLQLTPSAVSYHVRVLEETVGVPLLYRSTRSLNTTDAGEALYRSALDMLNAAQSGLDLANRFETHLSGKLKVALTSAISHSYLSERISKFAKGYTKVDLHLHYDNRESDLIGEQFDLALRIGKLKDSGLKCKLLWQMPRCLIASPKLLEGLNHTPTVKELEKLCWIKFEGMEQSRNLTDQDGNNLTVRQFGNITVNSIEAMVDLTILGAGISSPPTHFVENHVRDGRLLKVLPDMHVHPLPVYAIWPPTKIPNPITRLFLDHVTR
jgi:DNA-binding transcriptional LysR family regulator